MILHYVNNLLYYVNPFLLANLFENGNIAVVTPLATEQSQLQQLIVHTNPGHSRFRVVSSGF
jgi:hypothetical protein